ncbi:bi-domain-containing oxidoreductase [Myxococcota bacterium]|nr:bi-domain-containing oxidoreductase [Myxococcota bacterium]
MKQVLQHLRTGELEVAELPAPSLSRGAVLIQSQASLISAGTERMLVEFGKANLLDKARSQPEKVKQVLEKVRTDGLLSTVDAVLRKLDQPLPLGYSNAGVVLEVGAGVQDIQVGDRVASNGHHAELVVVPRNLCVKLPDNVSSEQGAFTTLGSIALQGMRLAAPAMGERFAVVGVGLLGLLSIQLLQANGCEVLAIDLNEERLNLAASYGAEVVRLGRGEDPIAHAAAWTQGRGVDGVLVTASAKTDEIMHQAAQISRQRGRIILVGVVGLNLRRSDFYEKELTFQVSCSYGPGRYDAAYEKQGHDYPYGLVRWTEQRNFEAFVQAMAKGRVEVDSMISRRFAIAQATQAYEVIRHDSEALGVVLTYPQHTPLRSAQMVLEVGRVVPREAVCVSVVGAGNFAVSTLIPALAKTVAVIDSVVDHKPFAARHAAKQAKALRALTSYKEVLADPRVDAVFLVTGHHVHAQQVCDALQAGKHVFVEKPLALNEIELSKVIAHARKAPSKCLMVGFNRRFSPHIQHIKQALRGRSGPLCMQMTVNAGYIPSSHWTQDPELGGGRIIGEGCHFLDLLSFLAGSPITAVSAMMVGEKADIREDKMSILLQMADGSVATLNYFANGSKSFPKETLELFFDQQVIRMDNFRSTEGFGFKSFSSLRTLRQDKGHQAEMMAFVETLRTGGLPPIPLAEIVNVTRASFAAVEAAREAKVVSIPQGFEKSESNGSFVPERAKAEKSELLAPNETISQDLAALLLSSFETHLH